MPDIRTIRAETAKELGLAESELDYITEDLVRDFEAASASVEAIVGDADDGGPRAEGRWGTYGNSITYSDSTVFWKQNRKGTANYGCGSAESWNAGKNWASYIVYRGRCPNGVAWYFIGNYRP